jgi:hypothetical protein
VDKAALLARRLPTDTVDIPDVGTVTVRALSRAEVDRVFGGEGPTRDEREIQFLALGIVEPALTEQDVAEWLNAASYAEVELVSAAIAKLSGIAVDSAKGATKSDSDGPDAQV